MVCSRQVQFAFNSCRLEAADRSLGSVVQLLRRHGTLRLRVTGHTQPDAPRFIQASLSLQRAEAVVKSAGMYCLVPSCAILRHLAPLQNVLENVQLVLGGLFGRLGTAGALRPPGAVARGF